MFKKFLILLLLSTSSLCFSNNTLLEDEDLEVKLEEDVLYSNKQKKTILPFNHLKETVMYQYSIHRNKVWGESFVYESYSRFKKECYLPIIPIHNEYYTNNAICFSLAPNFDEKSKRKENYYATTYSSEKLINLKSLIKDGNLDFEDKMKSVSVTEWKIDKVKKEIRFENVRLGKNALFDFTYSFPIIDIESEIYYFSTNSIKITANIKVKKLDVYSLPDLKAKEKGSLVKDDKVLILSQKIDQDLQRWFFIEFKNKKYWIKSDKLMLN